MAGIRQFHQEKGLMAEHFNEETTDIVVVGTGIHGAHMCIRIGADPFLRELQILTVDPSSEPLALWKERTGNTTMTYLRSPASHGLHPFFPSLRRFAEAGTFPRPFIPPYHRPSLTLFNRHAEEELKNAPIRRRHITGSVVDIVRRPRNGRRRPETLVTVRRPDGSNRYIAASVVVLAPGQPALNIPAPFADVLADVKDSIKERIIHIYDPRFSPALLSKARSVAVIGGGIGGTHLALTLASRGVTPDMWCRTEPETRQFDSDPCFIGPRCRGDFLQITDLDKRRELILKSRRVGSVPSDIAARREKAVSAGTMRVIRDTVDLVASKNGQIVLHGKEFTGRYDYVVLATGFGSGPPAEALIDRLATTWDLARGSKGFPAVDSSLRWRSVGSDSAAPNNREGPPIYCMGALAELELGPPARNIIGAHLGGRLIVPSLREFFSRRP